MSTTPNPAVVLHRLSFAWPDGSPALTNLEATFHATRTGLTGANGAGKTTLLRLIAGELKPTAGSITLKGRVSYLPQHLTLRTHTQVADLLGIRARLDALRALEGGDPDPRHFETIGDDWDIETAAQAVLAGIGLGELDLDRLVGTLSGGEVMLVALAGLRLARTEVVLLDEPTNNLDQAAKERFYEVVQTWRGALVVVSHDVALLNLMQETAELFAGALSVFGGSFDQYQEHLAGEQAAAEQALRAAEQRLKTEQRQKTEAEARLARRSRYGRAQAEKGGIPKIVLNQRKSDSQAAAGKLRGELDQRVDSARQALEYQATRVRTETKIRIQLPDPEVPTKRRLAELRDASGTSILLQGPERLALTGPNGIGKTRLLETLIHPELTAERPVYALRHTERIGYLPQRLDHLDDATTLFDAVRRAAPTSSPHQVRANLARFLFRGQSIDRRVGELSGGERFRAALAHLLLADPPHQLLVLDEPTNNLDLSSVNELVEALEAYHGGLIVVSHDASFLNRLGINLWVTLNHDGSTPYLLAHANV
ncbi:MAG: ATP-binding cassette domain-containing protein [Bifidobacteriaceae bacterium]|jgi:ATPase subunit of ABC transporter with duplicated ATPase domains|nr:ATP-binding cassette domain-containing protein [Bifidobacteriaceae bacterium]